MSPIKNRAHPFLATTAIKPNYEQYFFAIFIQQQFSL